MIKTKSIKYLEEIISVILSDKEYLNYMDKIKQLTKEFAESSKLNGSIAFNHDLDHSLFVAKKTEELLLMLNCDKYLSKLGYIAGLLHDIGMVKGKKDHAQNGFIMAQKYLESFSLDDSDKELILNGILNHGDCINMHSLIDACITIADKAHFDKSRVIKSKYSKYSKLNHIVDNKILIKNDTLVIKYNVDKDFDKAIFYIIPKSIDTIVLVGEKLGLETKFYINEKEEKFSDRDSYNGYVYS